MPGPACQITLAHKMLANSGLPKFEGFKLLFIRRAPIGMLAVGKGQNNRSPGGLPTSKHRPSMPDICNLPFSIMA